VAKLPMMLRKGKLRLFGKRAGDKAARQAMFDRSRAAGGDKK